MKNWPHWLANSSPTALWALWMLSTHCIWRTLISTRSVWRDWAHQPKAWPNDRQIKRLCLHSFQGIESHSGTLYCNVLNWIRSQGKMFDYWFNTKSLTSEGVSCHVILCRRYQDWWLPVPRRHTWSRERGWEAIKKSGYCKPLQKP